MRPFDFFIEKYSLTLSQQVSPQRHCAGSLQAFYDKRPKIGNIQTQNSNNTYRNRDSQSLLVDIRLGQNRIGRRLLRMGFFYRKNSLRISQQVGPRRHCTGSLQNRVWRRLLRMSRWMWSSKLWHYLFGQVKPRRRPSVLVEYVHKQICGERTYLSLKFNFFKLNSIMGSVEHLAKWWLMSNNTKVK